MRIPPLQVDFIQFRVCKPICAKLLTLPYYNLKGSKWLRKYHNPRKNCCRIEISATVQIRKKYHTILMLSMTSYKIQVFSMDIYSSPGVTPYLFLKVSIKWLALVYPTIHTTSFTLYFPLCNKRCAISMRFSTMYS